VRRAWRGSRTIYGFNSALHTSTDRPDVRRLMAGRSTACAPSTDCLRSASAAAAGRPHGYVAPSTCHGLSRRCGDRYRWPRFAISWFAFGTARRYNRRGPSERQNECRRTMRPCMRAATPKRLIISQTATAERVYHRLHRPQRHRCDRGRTAERGFNTDDSRIHRLPAGHSG